MADTPVRSAPRRVVIAEAAAGNNYRVLSSYTAGLEAEFRRRGWPTRVARAGRRDFLPTLLQDADDPDAIALLGHFFYDLRVTAQNHYRGAGIGDLFRGRIAAMWADHPFTGFMAPRLRDADPRVVYFPADPGFVDVARALNPELRRFHPLSLPVLYLPEGVTTPPPVDARPIDVLIPLTFRKVDDRAACLGALDALPDRPPLARLARALFERLRDERLRYPYAVFLETAAELGIGDEDLRRHPQLLRDTLGVLGTVDLVIRNERRIELLQDLLRDVDGLRVQVVGQLPEGLPLPAGVEACGVLDADELGRRMLQSRWVVHGHPTYPQAMHERVLTAMAAGCAVLSDEAPALDAAFQRGEEWVHARPGASLRALLAEHPGDAVQRLSAAAQAAVRGRHGMAQHVDGLLAGLQAHGAR